MAVEKNVQKTELFEKTAVSKAVFRLAVPTVISSLVMVIYNLADTYFVGYLNDPVQNAAVTLSAPVLLSFNAVNNLFGVGAGTAMSRALGRHDYEEVQRSSAFGFYCALVSSLIFSILSTVFKLELLSVLGADADTVDSTKAYLFWTTSCGAVPAILNVVMANFVRSEGSSMHAGIGTMSGCLLNIILDPIFILPKGLDMGAAGAGLATFISNCFACVYFFVLLVFKRNSTYVSLSLSKAKPSKRTLKEVFSVGIPAAIQNLLNVTGMTVLNNFAAGYGTNPVAAIGIASKINMIPMNIGMGISQGVMPLIGYTYSNKNTDRMKKTISFAAKIMIGFLTFMGVVYYLAARQITSLFIDDKAVIEYSTAFFASNVSRYSFFRNGFFRCGSVSGVRQGRTEPLLCCCKKNRFGNSCAFYSQQKLSSVRSGICAAYH